VSADPDTPTTEPRASRLDRWGFRRVLTVIVAAGAIWRYGYLFVVKRHQGLLLNDSLYYSWQGYQLAHGVYFKDLFGVREAAEHGPFTAIVLAPVSWGAHVVFQQRFATATLGVATVALIGILGRRIGGSRVGLVAAGIAAVYPNLWINDGLVMSESLGALLVTLILLALLALLDRPDVRRALLVGALFGLAVLTRSELILAVPIAALVTWRWISPRRDVIRLVLAMGAATLIVIAPWVVYNMGRFQQNVLLSTNDGTTLIGANCPETYSSAALGGWSLYCVLDVQGPPGADDSVRSSIQRRTAISYAKHHLSRLPLVALARLARGADLYKVDNLVHQDVGEEKARWASWAGIVSWWILAPMAGIGLTRTNRRAASVLLVPIVLVGVTCIAFYGAHRLRLPLEPAVVVGAAILLCSLAQRRHDHPRHARLAGGGEGVIGTTHVDAVVGAAVVPPQAAPVDGAVGAEEP
jgi:4-amino-4-deoxy-L-arabinose transferase-like glycosyltransferase